MIEEPKVAGSERDVNKKQDLEKVVAGAMAC